MIIFSLLVLHPLVPGGWGDNWGTQGSQDYAYFESGFATSTRQLPTQNQDSSMQLHHRTKRHRKIKGPTKDHKIQIYFNITGRMSKRSQMSELLRCYCWLSKAF